MNIIKKFIRSKFQPKVITKEIVRDVYNPNLQYISEVSAYLLTKLFPNDEFLKGRLTITVCLTGEEHHRLKLTVEANEGVTQKYINLPLLPLLETLDWLTKKGFRVTVLGYSNKVEGYVRDCESNEQFSSGKVDTYSQAISPLLDYIISTLFSQDH